MIIVIGSLLGRLDDSGGVEPAGFVATFASSAAQQGADVQVVARLGDDDVGDAILLRLAAAGIGHVASMRDAGRATPLIAEPAVDDLGDETQPIGVAAVDGLPLEAADVGLALRYLADYRVVVIAPTLDQAVIEEASSAARWAGAHLVVLTTNDDSGDVALPDDALVVSAEIDAEGLADRLGRYAASVDSGEGADIAYAALTGATTDS